MTQMITSIHGRRVGLDENDALIVRTRIGANTKVAGTSDSTATKLANNGLVSVVTTTDDTWTLDDPFRGARVTLYTGSSSSGIHSINLGNSLCYTTAGIAGSTVTLTGMGASVTLLGLSTALWFKIGQSGSTGSADVSS